VKKSRNWGRIGGYQRNAMKRALIERDGTKCFHCGRPTRSSNGADDAGEDVLTIDHWPIPKRNLPVSEWLEPSRAVIACQGCNRRHNRMSQGKAA
jgi:5-methylcytosine-specific restriction endonuclease McrA